MNNLSFSTAEPRANTMGYRSPEDILRNACSKVTDMWSLGCILAELKTGTILFEAGYRTELLKDMVEVTGTKLGRLLYFNALLSF